MDNTEINTDTDKKRTRKLGKYKYADGYAEHYKKINYQKAYYMKHNNYVKCNLCDSQISAIRLKQHQQTKRCSKLRCIIRHEDIDTTHTCIV
jgi:RNA polymerase-binding transcription factor DksA